MMDIYSNIGKNLREIRKLSGFSQSELANHFGVTYQQVQKYEAGSNRLPVDKLVLASLIFNVPVDAFVEGVAIHDAPVRENIRLCGKISRIKCQKTRRQIAAITDILTK